MSRSAGLGGRFAETCGRFSPLAWAKKGNDDGTAATLVPGPSRSESFIAQRRRLTRSLF